MVVRVEVEPALLRWAVDRAGWDKKTAESRAPYLNEWIRGTRRPTLKQIEDFSRATHVPFGQLFLPEPPDEPLPIPDMRTVGDDGVSKPSGDLLDTIYLCQNRQEWYREYLLEEGAPAVEIVGSAVREEDPAAVAERIRTVLGLHDDAASRRSRREGMRRELIDRIEELGVLVMVSGIVGSNTRRRLDPREFRGFALVDSMAPLIFVNGRDTRAAQVFTLVHELAHLCLGGSALSDPSDVVRPGVGEERWCNAVAAAALVPEAVLRTEYRGDVGVEALEGLAGCFGVSTLVVLNRLYDLRLISWDVFRRTYGAEHERLMSLMAERRPSDGGSYYNTVPLRLGRRFSQAVLLSAFEGRTSYREAYELLQVRKHATFQELAANMEVA